MSGDPMLIVSYEISLKGLIYYFYHLTTLKRLEHLNMMFLNYLILLLNQPKDHPYHVCFKLADWFQRRRLLNNFPIGSCVKTMSDDGGHFGPRSGSLNTILEVDHLRTIDDMFPDLHPRWPPSGT
jgi:hypothetical protein